MTAPSPHYSPLPGDDPNEIVKAFAANRAFRAAEWEELTTEDNPYRRPVRPDDLAWLDYSGPMPADKALKLSGLLGHRMLRNVYDLDALHLPPARTPAVAADQKAFYSHDNRVLSALAKPVLEHHLFSFLAEGRTPLERPGVAAATSHVIGAFEQRGAAGNKAIDAVERTVGKREAGTFLMLQLSAFLPAMNAAVGRAALGEYDLACDTLRPFLVDEYRSWVNSSAAYTKMLEGGGLKTPAAAYWQLYLTTSLARGNHLHHLSVNR
ncbi:peptide synthetase, partial [Streptomyces sp. SID7499]|nr:peptide synthetase [Streptomyces sp. SID7499]